MINFFTKRKLRIIMDEYSYLCNSIGELDRDQRYVERHLMLCRDDLKRNKGNDSYIRQIEFNYGKYVSNLNSIKDNIKNLQNKKIYLELFIKK